MEVFFESYLRVLLKIALKSCLSQEQGFPFFLAEKMQPEPPLKSGAFKLVTLVATYYW